jgi:hypothetical protein
MRGISLGLVFRFVSPILLIYLLYWGGKGHRDVAIAGIALLVGITFLLEWLESRLIPQRHRTPETGDAAEKKARFKPLRIAYWGLLVIAAGISLILITKGAGLIGEIPYFFGPIAVAVFLAVAAVDLVSRLRNRE